MTAKVLLVEDDRALREALADTLMIGGHEFRAVECAEDAVAALGEEAFSLVISDVNMPGMDGHQLLGLIRARYPQLPVLLMTAYGAVERAVDAIRQGAADYLVKPFEPRTLLDLVARHALGRVQADAGEGPVACEPASQQLLELAARVARSDSTVLISGESGTGKEVLARYIHQQSKRADGPFIAINCAAIPDNMLEATLFGHEKGAFTGADKAKKGKFELADKSTLFLDEIADMSLKTQAKILRILQEQKFERVGGTKSFRVDVRVIAATNKDLVREMEEGRFRQDLYYRLNVFPVTVPSLRDRAEDIPGMIEYFSQRMVEEHSLRPVRFDREALDVLKRYAWPGNVRELKNFVERLFILYQGQEVGVSMLPPEYRASAALDSLAMVPEGLTDFKEARARFEEAFLRRQFARANGNIARLAEIIGLERTYLYRKLKTYGIGGEEGRPQDGDERS